MGTFLPNCPFALPLPPPCAKDNDIDSLDHQLLAVGYAQQDG